MLLSNKGGVEVTALIFCKSINLFVLLSCFANKSLKAAIKVSPERMEMV